MVRMGRVVPVVGRRGRRSGFVGRTDVVAVVVDVVVVVVVAAAIVVVVVVVAGGGGGAAALLFLHHAAPFGSRVLEPNLEQIYQKKKRKKRKLGQ